MSDQRRAMKYGEQVVADAVARKLKELLPLAEIDLDVVAEALIRAADLAVYQSIDDREAALQEALGSLMAYYNNVVKELRTKVLSLQAERASLLLSIAAKTRV